MKNLALTLIVCIIGTQLIGQSTQIDSLTSLLKKEEETFKKAYEAFYAKNEATLLRIETLQKTIKEVERKSTEIELEEVIAVDSAVFVSDDDVPAMTEVPAVAEVPQKEIFTSIKFDKDTYNWGKCYDGDKVTHIYKFRNTGNAPLIISNAKGSCGCTVPEWPKDAIVPGGTGEIKVVFDSKGKGSPGGREDSKKITITANTDPADTYLTIMGKIDKKATKN